ncbi:hypothetical protein [Burkholderia stagnalis]
MKNNARFIGEGMRGLVISLVISFSAIAGCARLPMEQRELAKVDWLSALNEIIRSGDFSDYQDVANKFNLSLAARSSGAVKDIDGKIVGENFSIETIPPANEFNKEKIRFFYGIYKPNDAVYKRVILSVQHINLHHCITEGDLFQSFGVARKVTHAHASIHELAYYFKGINDIDVTFRFDGADSKCASEFNIFQNRWK